MAAPTDSAEEAEKFSWSCLPGGGFVILRQSSERHRELQIRLVESQRDSGLQPKVARDELPWVFESNGSQPQRGCVPVHLTPAETPLGFDWFCVVNPG